MYLRDLSVLTRSGREISYVKGDERILGDAECVDQVLSQVGEAFNCRHHLSTKVMDLERLSNLASTLFHIEKGQIWTSGKNRRQVQAQSLLCYCAIRKLGGKHVIHVPKIKSIHYSGKQSRGAGERIGQK